MGGLTLPLATDAFSGRKLGKYEVICRLSTGGMAEIFLASQRGLAGFRKLVVLKQILPDIAGEEEFVQMFLDEARVTAAFNHPHIAQVFDLDVADGELFLAMEFVPGATLVEVAKGCRAANEPIPVGFSLEAVRDTALALHYAHTFTDPLGRTAPVIHRDVAEKNIMVTYEGVTKLLDFGIAKNLARKGRTQVGMVKGTSGYMSPEQILGESLDARSDLFSLGVVLHECLTGLRLFHAKTPEAGAGAVLQGQVPPPSRSNKAIPPELDAIVLKALGRKREDRYTTTLEFARALERAVGPLIWHPEQSAELISRLFSERRDQTRQLLVAGRALSGESTGEVNVAHILSPPAPLSPEPVTAEGLPQITAALPQSTRPPTSSMTGLPSVKPPAPPAQEPLQTKPPTPPRGAPSRRLSTGVPASTPPESAALRRPVFDPIPQKRASTTASNEPAVPPPPPQENTSRMRPGDAPPPPPLGAWVDQNRTRAAPLEESLPSQPEEEDDESQPELRTALEPVLRTPPGSRPSRMDLHTLGTVPHAEGPASLHPPDEEATVQESKPAARTSSPRVRPTISSDRIPSSPGSGHSRPPRRRPATPPPEEAEDSQVELTTHPVRVALAEPPAEDTNETLIPEGEEAPSFVTSQQITDVNSRKSSGALWVLLAVGVLVVGGLGAVVGLGLDGGRLSTMIGLGAPPPPPPELGRMEPLQVPVQRAQPAPPAPAAPGAAAPSKTPEPPAAVVTAPPATPSATTPADTLPPQTVAAESTPADKGVGIILDEPEDEPSQPEKKVRPAAAGNGTLTLVTTPYAKVYLGRRYLGDTPLFKINVPSGKHSLKLVGADGKSLRLPVDIKPGETTALKLALDQIDPG